MRYYVTWSPYYCEVNKSLNVCLCHKKNADFLVITGNEGNDNIFSTNPRQLWRGQKIMLVNLLPLRFRLLLWDTSRHNTPPRTTPTINVMRHIATNTPLLIWSLLSANLSAKTNKQDWVSCTQSWCRIILIFFIGSYLKLVGGQIYRWCHEHFFVLLEVCDKIINFLVLCICPVIDHRRCQNVLRTFSDVLGHHLVYHFFVLTTF